MIPWAPPTPQGSGAGNRISELLLERGRAQADAAARSGQIWGNALQNVGQVAAGAVQQHGEAKRDAALTAAIETWDGQDPQALAAGLVKIAGPEGLKLAQGVMAFRKLGTETDEKEQRSNFETTLKTAATLPYPLFERWYGGLREKLAPGGAKFLGWNPAEIPEAPTPEVHANLQALLKAQQGPEKPIELSGNARLVQDGKVIVDAVPDAPKAPAVGSFEDHVTQKYGPRPTPEQIVAARKEYNQADDRPRVAGSGAGGGLTPNQEALAVDRLTKAWDKARAPLDAINRQVGAMEAGLTAARRGDMNAGSQAVIMTFNKILDPDSVVRESEFDRSAAGQALIARAKGAVEKLMSGGAGMPISELEKFAQLARDIAKAQAGSRMEAIRSRTQAQADHFKIDPRMVFLDGDPGGAPAAPPKGGGKPGGGKGGGDPLGIR